MLLWSWNRVPIASCNISSPTFASDSEFPFVKSLLIVLWIHSFLHDIFIRLIKSQEYPIIFWKLCVCGSHVFIKFKTPYSIANRLWCGFWDFFCSKLIPMIPFFFPSKLKYLLSKTWAFTTRTQAFGGNAHSSVSLY